MAKAYPKKKSFKLNTQQIVSSILIAVILGVLGWVGASLKSGLNDINDLKTKISNLDITIKEGLTKSVEEIKEDVKEYKIQQTTKLGSVAGDLRQLEILINRIDAIIIPIKKKLGL